MVAATVTTPETVRRVLRSWMAIEVLTPQVTKDGWAELAAEKQGQQRNKDTAAGDDPAQWQTPQDGDPTPWPPLLEQPDDGETKPAESAPGTERKHPWYSVILGALPARQAFEHLDAAFAEQADEDETNRHTKGHVIAASAVLDQWGVLVPDTLAIASFAWGLGHMLGGRSAAELADWVVLEQGFKARFADILSPLGSDARPRSLTWRDLRAASATLADELGLPSELWVMTPCAIRTLSKDPPKPDFLSSFFLSDLVRVLREADHLPDAASAYLGMRPPAAPWDALTDRCELASLLQPGLLPLGRWPGPGLHPLTLLQQAAVNAIVRDLGRSGIAAVNGPPGTGKTTLLRDVVAHVLVSRAELLAKLDDPRSDLSGLDLMDFALVVASKNNAAVENVSLELPVRAKALDRSVWRDKGLSYFPQTADAVLGVPPNAQEEDHAWGLMAARLGRAEHRRTFFDRFWWDDNWGLWDWLDRAGWPDTWRSKSPGKLAQLDPPPSPAQADRRWREARQAFRQALDRCRRMRYELEVLADLGSRLRDVTAQLPAAESRLAQAERELAAATPAVGTARDWHESSGRQQAIEAAKLTALSSVAPSRFARLLRTRAWRSHEAELRGQLARLSEAQDATRTAAGRLAIAGADKERCLREHRDALAARDTLRRDAAQFARSLEDGQSAIDGAPPGCDFWKQPDADLYRAAPWNGGAFQAARDELFVAAVRLHQAFIVAAAQTVKRSLHTIAKAGLGGPNAPKPMAYDWGIFFLLVPVVSTTFASIGSMFQGFGASQIGWLLIDEAGQAPPQEAVGAIWRARRAVVIGDPLQIAPVVSTPQRTTQLIYNANDTDPAPWAAPEQSAQTLADRASPIQGRFRALNGEADREERITGIPLLVHRRCEQPMFGIANRIAYDERMVFATAVGPSKIRDLLGDSAWIDVDAPSTGKWVEAEGQLIAQAIAKLCRAAAEPPDLYVICPFKVPAARLRMLLLDKSDVLPRLSKEARKTWIKARVGTVHTFQGKEAEAVILMLGAGRGAKPGSRSWAGGTPNLLNVAATRAKRVLYVVGNRSEWQGAGVFVEAAHALPPRRGREWLCADQVVAAE